MKLLMILLHGSLKSVLTAATSGCMLPGVQEAHSIIMVVDGKVGLTAGDEEIIDWLRKSHSKKPLVLAVNKCESPAKADLQAADFWNTGLEPFAVSAISGAGTGEMLDSLVATLPKIE